MNTETVKFILQAGFAGIIIALLYFDSVEQKKRMEAYGQVLQQIMTMNQDLLKALTDKEEPDGVHWLLEEAARNLENDDL